MICNAMREKKRVTEDQWQGFQISCFPIWTNIFTIVTCLEAWNGKLAIHRNNPPPCVRRLERNNAWGHAKEEMIRTNLQTSRKPSYYLHKFKIATNKHPDWAEIGESACKVIENQLLVEEKSKLKDEVQELKSTISAPNHEIEALKNEINVTKNSNGLCQAKQNDKIKQVRETWETSLENKQKYASSRSSSDTDSNYPTSNCDSS